MSNLLQPNILSRDAASKIGKALKARGLIKNVDFIPSLTVAMAGIKGGSLKSTTSRLAARGFRLLGFPAVVITTDARTIHGADDLRYHQTLDGSTSAAFAQAWKTVQDYRKQNPLTVIIDGAAARGVEHDVEIAKFSDLVFFTTPPDPEDVDVLFKTLELPIWQDDPELVAKLHILRSRWPTRKEHLVDAERRFNQRYHAADMAIANINLAVPIPDSYSVKLVNLLDDEMQEVIDIVDNAQHPLHSHYARMYKEMDELSRYTALVVLAAAGIVEMPRFATMSAYLDPYRPE